MTPQETIEIVVEDAGGQTLIRIPDGVSKAEARRIGKAVADLCGGVIVSETFGGDLTPMGKYVPPKSGNSTKGK